MEYIDVLLKDIVSFSTVYLKMTQTELSIFDDKGSIEVYSAGAEVIYHLEDKDVSRDRLNEASEQKPVLSMATNGDGSAGRNFFIHTKPFGVTADRIVMRPLRENISVYYLRYQLEGIKKRYGFNRKYKALKCNIENIPVKMPIRKDGEYDLDTQVNLAGKYFLIEERKALLQDHVDEILNKVPKIKVEGVSKVPITKLFDLSKSGGKSIYTTEYCLNKTGNVPVYAASSTVPLGYTDTADYPANTLTWARNGLAGYITIISEPFCINADRGVLIPFPDIESQIDVHYVKYVLEPLFRSRIKGRIGERGRNEYTKLHPSMIKDVEIPMPLTPTGEYDIDKQKQIAKILGRIDMMKSDLIMKMNRIMDVTVMIE